MSYDPTKDPVLLQAIKLQEVNITIRKLEDELRRDNIFTKLAVAVIAIGGIFVVFWIFLKK